MLNTWDGAVQFLSPVGDKVAAAIEIARFLGFAMN
jgi:hypothetical protein